MKLAAIDLDGTLLAPDLSISPANLEAVAKLQAAGIHTVIATGRHYANFQNYFPSLPGIEWVVSAQGCEISDLHRKQIVEQAFLDVETARQVHDEGLARGFSLVIYTEDDIYAGVEDEWTDFYAGIAGRRPNFSRWEELRTRRIFKIIWMGEEQRVAVLVRNPPIQNSLVSQVRTHAQIYEFLPPGLDKGTGVAALARHLGVRPDETVVFGDAENDIPMFAWAGRSFAMPHAWESLKKIATDAVPEGPPETAFARAVELVLN